MKRNKSLRDRKPGAVNHGGGHRPDLSTAVMALVTLVMSLALGHSPSVEAAGAQTIEYGSSSISALCDTLYQRDGSGVRAYWDFNDSANPAADAYGSNHGTVKNGALWTANGKAGGALSYDGINDYVNMGKNLTISDWPAYSFSVWFLNNHGGSWGQNGYGQKIFAKSDSWQDVYLEVGSQSGAAGQLVFHTSTSVPSLQRSYLVDGSRNYGDNAWHHAVVTKSGAHGELWVDGVLMHSVDDVKSPMTDDLPLYVGYTPSSDDFQQRFWSGKIDELVLFDRAISAIEIQKLFTNGSSGISACSAPAQIVPTQSMPSQAARQTAISLKDAAMNQQAIVVGGQTAAGQASNMIAQYDASTKQWQSSQLNEPRQSNALVMVQTLATNQAALVIGGAGNDGQAKRSTEVYDPNTKQALPGPQMVEARIAPAAVPITQQNMSAPTQVIVAGGNDGVRSKATVEQYNASAGQFAPIAPMQQARESFKAIPLPPPPAQQMGKILAIGGEQKSPRAQAVSATGDGVSIQDEIETVYLADVEIYNPETDTWMPTGSLNVPRSSYSAVMLLDGRVLVVGGMTESGPTATAEIYDPNSGVWTQIESLNAPLAEPTATLMPDGTVLVIGESNGASIMQVYYPATNLWGDTASLTEGRAGHTATLLGTGEVLIAGGAVAGTASDEADLYTPPQASFITVVKEAIPQNGDEVFEFTSDISGATTFSLDGAADDDSILTQLTFGPLATGSYTISESIYADYLTTVSCDNDQSSTTNHITVDLEAGESVTCTFTNEALGSITVVKQVTGYPPEAVWTFTGSLGVFTLPAVGGQTRFQQLEPGGYTINETGVAGYTQAVSCDSGETGASSVTIALDPSEDVTCTFTNTAIPANLTVVKETNPDGGMGFPFQVNSKGPWPAWGESGSGNGQFATPRGPAVSPSGVVYITDGGNNRIQRFSPSGAYLDQWGSPGTAEGQFTGPTDVAVFGNNVVYVADYMNNRIQKFDADGDFLLMWGWGVADGTAAFQICTLGCQGGSSGDGPGQFYSPISLDTDATGNVYVADMRNNRVQKFAPDGTYLGMWGGLGTVEGQFDRPHAIDVDAAGHVYVADTYNYRIQRFDTAGNFQLMWGWGVADGTAELQTCTTGCRIGLGGGGAGQFVSAHGVEADADGHVYVIDYLVNRVQQFTAGGAFLGSWGSEGSGGNQFSGPVYGALSLDGRVLYVSEFDGNRIHMMTTPQYTALDDNESANYALAPGAYDITEILVDGWDLAGITCDGGQPQQSGGKVAITLVAGDDVTCTFTNAQPGSITIVKEVVGQAPPTDWQYTGNLGAFTLPAAGGNRRFEPLAAGDYTINETARSGYVQSVTCTGGRSGTGSVTVDLQPGEDVTCTFTNTAEPGSITIIKEVVGQAPPADWQYTGDLGAFTLPAAGGNRRFEPLAAGDYTINETAKPGYVQSVTCTGGRSGTGSVTVDLQPGEDVTCTFTNTAEPGNISIVKQVVGAAPDGDWSFAGDLGNFTIAAGGGRKDFDAKTPGVYTVTEETKTSYVLESIVCDDADSTGDQGAATATVRLQPGETVVCTFTNRRESQPPEELIYISPMASGSVRGIAYDARDILTYSPAADAWSLFFDGSRLGVTKNLNGFHLLPDGRLLLTFNQIVPALPQVGKVMTQDVVQFTPAAPGDYTSGTFAMYLDGSDVGLSLSGENVDALTVIPDGRILLSAKGVAAVKKPDGSKLTAADEDVLAFTPTTLGLDTTGQWALYLDGSTVPGLSVEDVAGLWFDAAGGDLMISVYDRFKVAELSGDANDIFRLHDAGGGLYTATLVWDAGAHGFSGKINAFDLGN